MRSMLYFALIFSILLVGSTLAQETPVNVSPTKGLLLGPGDEITGKVIGEPDFDFVATINDDGKIELPFSDAALVARCHTENQLKADIVTALSKYLKNPQLSLRVTDRKSRPPVP